MSENNYDRAGQASVEGDADRRFAAWPKPSHPQVSLQHASARVGAVLRCGQDGDGRRSVASFGAPCNAPDRRFRAWFGALPVRPRMAQNDLFGAVQQRARGLG